MMKLVKKLLGDEMKVKSIRIEKINNDGSKTLKTVNFENAKNHLREVDRIDINHIITKINKIKQKIYKKSHKETPPQYLLRKLKNLIERRNKLLSSFTNWGDEILKYNDNEIIEYYKKYLVEKARSQQSSAKKSSGDRFGTESNKSFLSIDTKRNKH